MVAAEQVAALVQQGGAAGGVAWQRNQREVRRQLDSVLPLPRHLHVARGRANVGRVQDAPAPEPAREDGVVGHVIAVAEEHQPDAARSSQIVEQGPRGAR